jgi:hypothetical protein
MSKIYKDYYTYGINRAVFGKEAKDARPLYWTLLSVLFILGLLIK